MIKSFSAGNVVFGDGGLVVVAGPCVLEDKDMALDVAFRVSGICSRLGLPYVFKASFDKANRTSIHSFRGPGIETGLEWLGEIRSRVGCPVLTDIHLPDQARMAAEVVDILQIPAFLCRQTDLVVAAASTGKVVNIKKGQFLAPSDMGQAVSKCLEAGNDKVILCERGNSFGYGQLVVDMRSLTIMRSLGYPVMFDATHSVQMPGAQGTTSGGDRRFVPVLARAAAAAGIDALFLETHPDPDSAKSDGPNMVPLDSLENLLERVLSVHRAASAQGKEN
ncbi:MAG: 3-deoxy-8-phosphooctulonate synthase [Thermovirgaceae bacterium]|nr:3-deoxy-8-phosphooctulonate synthase [Thermovirgaceae bacterium]